MRLAGSQSTGIRDSAVVRTAKAVPNVGLVMLKLDDSNIVSQCDALRHHLEVTYGRVGCFIQHNALHVRVIVTAQQINAMYPGHNADGLRSLHFNATIEHMKYTEKDKEYYVEMFSLIEQCVSFNGMD